MKSSGLEFRAGSLNTTADDAAGCGEDFQPTKSVSTNSLESLTSQTGKVFFLSWTFSVIGRFPNCHDICLVASGLGNLTSAGDACMHLKIELKKYCDRVLKYEVEF